MDVDGVELPPPLLAEAQLIVCCNGTDPLLLICDILQCFFKITQIVELLASS